MLYSEAAQKLIDHLVGMVHSGALRVAVLMLGLRPVGLWLPPRLLAAVEEKEVCGQWMKGLGGREAWA